MDFTSVDHKEVSLCNKIKFLDFTTTHVCFTCSYRRGVLRRLNSLSSRKAESVFKQEWELITHQSLQTLGIFEVLVLFTTFPGCESPEEQQKSDHYCPDRSCKYTAMMAAVWDEFVALILQI